MSYDPLSEVVDAPLPVSQQAVQELIALRALEHFPLLPGIDTADEKARLSLVLNGLLDRLNCGRVLKPK